MPIFRFNKAFGVGRGIKAFFNFQGGLTRGEVPEPKTLVQQSEMIKKKDRQIYRLTQQVRRQGAELFRLGKEVRATDEPAGDAWGGLPPLQVSDRETGALPDYVVIGAMRCGTSRFHNLLTQHPYVPRAAEKELHFFDRPERFAKGIEWYRSCFPVPEWKDGQRTINGEATPMYLFDPLVPERMAQVVPDAKLIVLLRNPVDRAYSHFHLRVRRGQETSSFEETVQEELALLADREKELSEDERRPSAKPGQGPNIVARGVYVDQLMHWRQFYDEEQMLVLKSEDFFKHTADTLKVVQSFLGVPYAEIEVPPRKTRREQTYEYEPMDPATRQRLEAFFEPHNRRLYDYLGRDFDW